MISGLKKRRLVCLSFLVTSISLTGCLSLLDSDVTAAQWNTCSRLCGVPVGLDRVVVGPTKGVACYCKSGAVYGLHYDEASLYQEDDD